MSLIEERCYVLKPEFTPSAYLQIYETQGLAVQRHTLGDLLGYFITEVGGLNALVHLWRYASFEDRLHRRNKLAADPQWQAYLQEIRPMLQSMSNRLLFPASFSPIK